MASHEITYTLRDRLGSVVTLSNHNNLILEHRSYDPFGKPRYGTMQASPSATLWNIAGGTPFTMRGFTDHEHIDEAQLIHMNGRVYDYNLGRFLSVDPFIQEPGNSQSLNPYSYIMNNPLAGTDPSGYIACFLSISCENQPLGDRFNYPSDCPFCVSAGGAAQSNGITEKDTPAETPENIGGPQDTAEGIIGNSDEREQAAGSINSLGENPRPIENTGWEYIGQRDGIDTYQTVHKRPDDRLSIGYMNDNFVTPAGLIAGYVERKTNESKRRWSDRYRNHSKIWDGARLVGNYAFVAGSLITAGTTVSDIVDMRNSGRSVEDQVLRGIDGVADIGFGVAAFFGPVGWLAAATYYGADYLSGGNLTEFIYRGITGRREEEVSSSKQ